MKLHNKTAYNELILIQEDTVSFRTIEEAKTKANKYGNARQSWMNILGKFEPTIVSSKTRLCNKCSKWELDDITRNPKEFITNLRVLRGDLRKLDVQIDDSEVMTHILSNLPEEYQNIVETIEYKLDYEENPLAIDRIHDKLSVKYYRMNEQSTMKTSREDENPFT